MPEQLEEEYSLKSGLPPPHDPASSGSIRRLSTEFLIETLFNPMPANTITPFTRNVSSPLTEQPSVESDQTSVKLTPSLISTHTVVLTRLSETHQSLVMLGLCTNEVTGRFFKGREEMG